MKIMVGWEIVIVSVYFFDVDCACHDERWKTENGEMEIFSGDNSDSPSFEDLIRGALATWIHRVSTI